MTPTYVTLPGGARLSHGGDEFVFVELSEEMDLAIALQVQSIAAELSQQELPGVVDVVPAHVSYMVRVDPDVLDPRDLVDVLIDLHEGRTGVAAVSATLRTRIIEIPVFYDDPWTREVVARFRDRHPSPEETDLEYTARLNGFADVTALVRAHSANPFIVTFNNFVPGNAECVQLVPRERQIDVPKYLRPRTETPARALGHGGNQATIYPAQSPGGFQLLGRAALPVVDFTMTGPGLENSPVLLPAPTVVKYQPVDQSGYDEVETAVAAGTYRLRSADIAFDLTAFTADPLDYASSLVGELP